MKNIGRIQKLRIWDAQWELLAQMVVGQGLERRIDHFLNFVAYFAIGEIAACTAFLNTS